MRRFVLAVLILVSVLVVATPVLAAGDRIGLSDTEISLDEGQSQVITVSLDEPIICAGEGICEVTFEISSADPSRVTTSENELNWQFNEWAQTRTFTIEAIDDGIENDTNTVTIETYSADSGSEYYNLFDPQNIVVTIGDLDAPQPLSNPAVSVSSSTVVVGSNVTVNGSGFKPNSQVGVTLNSTPVFLGNATTNGSGAFSASFKIPSNVTLGAHTIIVTGLDPDDNQVSTSVAVNITGLPATGTNSSVPILIASLIMLTVGIGILIGLQIFSLKIGLKRFARPA